jgi:hypothetical protein
VNSRRRRPTLERPNMCSTRTTMISSAGCMTPSDEVGRKYNVLREICAGGRPLTREAEIANRPFIHCTHLHWTVSDNIKFSDDFKFSGVLASSIWSRKNADIRRMPRTSPYHDKKMSLPIRGLYAETVGRTRAHPDSIQCLLHSQMQRVYECKSILGVR